MVSAMFPSEYAKPMFPVGPNNAWHGSGVVTPSGNFLYVYSDGNSIWEATYKGWVEFLYDKQALSDVGGVWFDGLPDTNVEAIGEYGGDPILGAACTVFWEGGTLWIVACYKTGTGAGAHSWTHLFQSPSGEGGDWSLADTIQSGLSGLGLSALPIDSCAGPPLVVGGAWVMAVSKWTTGESLRPAIWRGSPGGGWTCVYEQPFGIFGVFGGMGSREVVETASGSLLWSAWSDSIADPMLGTRFVGAYSNDGGSSWTPFEDLPVDPGELLPHHQQLGAAGRIQYRANENQIEQATDPIAGPWEAMWRLNLDRGRGAQAMLWREIIPGTWMLFSHDKVWWMFGGWVVGRNGMTW